MTTSDNGRANSEPPKSGSPKAGFQRSDAPQAQNLAQVLIRTCRYPEEYPAVCNLWAHAGKGVHLGRSDEPEEIEKILQRTPELFLVAERDGLIIGAVLGGFDGRRGLIYHLTVDAAYRRQGVAAALMETLEQRLRELGCNRSYLLTTRDNLEAIRLYEGAGWEKLDLYVLAKNL